jgi:hypothetical protein
MRQESRSQESGARILNETIIDENVFFSPSILPLFPLGNSETREFIFEYFFWLLAPGFFLISFLSPDFFLLTSGSWILPYFPGR